MAIDEEKFYRNRSVNGLQTILLLSLLFLLALTGGYLLAGTSGLLIVVMTLSILLLPGIHPPPGTLLAQIGAARILPTQAPDLYRMIQKLSQRADLPAVPEIYYLSSDTPNAFTIGSADNSAIAVSAGLLRRLNSHEVAAVMAHETAHIRNNDLWLLNLADRISRICQILSITAIMALVIILPAFLMGAVSFYILAGTFLIGAAAQGAMVLQSALSRTREFEADLTAVELTGDAGSLISALQKIDEKNLNLFSFFRADITERPPSLLRTHPCSDERIRKLSEVAGLPRYKNNGPAIDDLFDLTIAGILQNRNFF